MNIKQDTLRECKKELTAKVSGRLKVNCEVYVDWFVKHRAKSEDELRNECNRSPEALKKTLEYWSGRHVFTQEDFIENLSYSGFDYKELKEISEAAKELSKQKKEAYIAELDRLKKEAENDWPSHQSLKMLMFGYEKGW